MNNAFRILMLIAVVGGFSITAIGDDLKGHFMARRASIETQPAECPNARHSPLYGI
jgi:hypothetical protein